MEQENKNFQMEKYILANIIMDLNMEDETSNGLMDHHTLEKLYRTIFKDLVFTLLKMVNNMLDNLMQIKDMVKEN